MAVKPEEPVKPVKPAVEELVVVAPPEPAKPFKERARIVDFVFEDGPSIPTAVLIEVDGVATLHFKVVY